MRVKITQTKLGKENAGKAALKQRLYDMARGAYGGWAVDLRGVGEIQSLCMEMGIEAWARWVESIENEFCRPLEYEWQKRINWNASKEFETLDSAVELLWARGVRA